MQICFDTPYSDPLFIVRAVESLDSLMVDMTFTDGSVLSNVTVMRTWMGSDSPNGYFDPTEDTCPPSTELLPADTIPRTCILTSGDGENADDCTTHGHEEDNMAQRHRDAGEPFVIPVGDIERIEVL